MDQRCPPERYDREFDPRLDEAGLRERATRMRGIDIAQTPDAVEPADIVVLHRLVCCYPDCGALLSVVGAVRV